MPVSASMVITPCLADRSLSSHAKGSVANVSRVHVYAPPAAPRALELGMPESAPPRARHSRRGTSSTSTTDDSPKRRS